MITLVDQPRKYWTKII